jgi:hypothetical protein
MLRSVESDQRPAIQAAQWRKPAALIQILDDAREGGIEMVRRHAVQHLPDVVVAGNRRHPQQGLRVRPPATLRQRPLMRQKRRALHEKYRERRKPDIGHRIPTVAPGSLIRKSIAQIPKGRDVSLKQPHRQLESLSESE